MKLVEFNDLKYWCEITKGLGQDSIWCDLNFIKTTSIVFNVKPHANIVYKDNIPIIGVVLYRRGNKIIQPNEYSYTALWINKSSDLIIQECLLYWLSLITKKFKQIEFNLHPNFKDIRVFYWSYFKANTYYTYINSLQEDIKFKSEIKSRIKKSQKLNIDFLYSKNSEIIQFHYDSFRNLGYSKTYSSKIARFAEMLLAAKLCYSTNARYRDTNVLIASSVILLDEKHKQAINMLVSSNKKSYETGVHSGLYSQNFSYLKSKNYLLFDLCGANTRGIGNFKRNFNGELTPFYRVKFNYYRWQIIIAIQKFKKFVSFVKKIF